MVQPPIPDICSAPQAGAEDRLGLGYYLIMVQAPDG
jgi:hypothetical protein